jgi:hypothetical protein
MAVLRFDGVYSCWGYQGTINYLRFYPDGTVIHAVSYGTLEEVKRWFNIEKFRMEDFHSVGRYDWQDPEISFSTTNSLGVVRYKGHLSSGQHMQLRYRSESTRGKGERTYAFSVVEEWGTPAE